MAGEGGGSKRAKAEKLGVPVVTLDELQRSRRGPQAAARARQQLHDPILQRARAAMFRSGRFMMIENRMRCPLAALT